MKMSKEPKQDLDELRKLLRNIEAKSKAVLPPKPSAPIEKIVPGRVVSTPVGEFYLVEDDSLSILSEDDDFTSAADLFFRRRQVNQKLLSRLDARLGELSTKPSFTINSKIYCPWTSLVNEGVAVSVLRSSTGGPLTCFHA